MKKSNVFKSMVLVLLGVTLLSLTGCETKDKKDVEKENNNQTQINVVSQNNSEPQNDVKENITKKDSTQEEKNTEEESTKVENTSKTENTKNDKSNSNDVKIAENKSTDGSQEETVKKVFLKYIVETSKEQHYKLNDYKIDNVQIVNLNEIRKIFPTDKETYKDAKSGDIFATITYSVKPAESMDESFWVAGNGEISGEWINKKVANVWVVKENGQYKIKSNGTGW